MNVLPAAVQGRRARICRPSDRARAQLRQAAGRRADRDRHPARVRAASHAPAPACSARGRAHRRSRPHALRPGSRRRAASSPRTCRTASALAGTDVGLALRSGACPRLCRQPPASRGRRDGEDRQPEGLAAGAAGVRAGRLLGDHPADDGGELFGAGHVRQQPVLLERRRLVQGAARSLDRARRPLLRLAAGATCSSPRSCWRSRSRSASSSRCRCRARAGASPPPWSSWRCRC